MAKSTGIGAMADADDVAPEADKREYSSIAKQDCMKVNNCHSCVCLRRCLRSDVLYAFSAVVANAIAGK